MERDTRKRVWKAQNKTSESLSYIPQNVSESDLLQLSDIPANETAIKEENLELNDRQIARIDEVHNAVFEM